jgi:eukaryotic-like serine/threonine-protein kinase
VPSTTAISVNRDGSRGEPGMHDMARPDLHAWETVSPYLDHALELSPDDRTTWLTALHATDPSLARSIEAWLAELDTATRTSFLEDADDVVPARTALAGLRVGAYRLISLIGHGGMGRVWLGERSDGRYSARVAVKLLNTALAGGEGDQRFAREGRILAKLTHAQIAHLLDAGVSAAGQPYLVLELVDGEPIDRYCDRHRLSIEARVRLFLDVLAPVAHAHANLVVHRDLKPSNVLVTTDGHVKLLDFGIAKLLEGESDTREQTVLTRHGASALTPAFAAPEQMTGGSITTATDIYALGVLFYVVLTGRHPAYTSGSSTAAMLTAIVDVDPPAPSAIVRDRGDAGAAALADARRTTPRQLHQTLTGDLDTIVATALKKVPTERYATATAFAEDLRRYLHDEPISARSDSVTYTAMKFVRRNRASVTLAALAILALVAGLAGTMMQAQRAATQRDFARRQLSRAEAINELNEFVMMDTAPPGTLLTSRNLLARAERLLDQVRGGSDDSRVDMLVSIGRLYASLGETGAATRVLRQAYELSRPLSEQAVRAKAGCALGSAVVKTGDLARARTLVREGVDGLPNEPQYAIEQIFCHLASAEVDTWVGEGHTAVEHVRAAQTIASNTGAVAVQVQLEIALMLAEAYRSAGRLVDADGAFRTAYDQVVAQGREHTELAGGLLNNWGNVLTELGRPLEAERMYRRKVAIGSAGGSDERIDPVVWTNIARALFLLGRLDEAAALAERAHRDATRAGDEVVANLSLLLTGQIQLANGEVARASATLATVGPHLERVYPPEHSVWHGVARVRSRIALAHGDRAAATAWAERAVTLSEARPDESDAVARSLLQRAAVAMESGLVDAAIADAAKAVALERDTIGAGSLSCFVGRAYLALGRALMAGQSPHDAHAALTSAVEHLEPTLGADHADTRSARELLSRLSSF